MPLLAVAALAGLGGFFLGTNTTKLVTVVVIGGVAFLVAKKANII